MLRLFIVFLISLPVFGQNEIKNNFVEGLVIQDLLNYPSCTLDSRDLSQDTDFISEVQELISGNIESVKSGLARMNIRIKYNPRRPSCNLKVNLTALYAAALERLGIYNESKRLYEKVLSYQGFNRDYQNTIRSRIKSLDIKISSKDLPLKTTPEKEKANPKPSPEKVEGSSEKISEQRTQIEELKNTINSQLKEIEFLSSRILELEALIKKTDDVGPGDTAYLERQTSEQNEVINNLEEANKSLLTEKASLEFKLMNLVSEMNDLKDKNESSRNFTDSETDNNKLEINDQVNLKIIELEDRLNSLSKQPPDQDSNFSYQYLLIAGILSLIAGILLGKNSSSNFSNTLKVYKPEQANEVEDPHNLSKITSLIDKILLQHPLELNENSELIYSYLDGFLSSYIDNEIASKIYRDRLLEKYFKKPIFEIEKYFRFNYSLENFDKGKAMGIEDSAGFEENEILPNLIKLINRN